MLSLCLLIDIFFISWEKCSSEFQYEAAKFHANREKYGITPTTVILVRGKDHKLEEQRLFCTFNQVAKYDIFFLKMSTVLFYFSLYSFWNFLLCS